MGNSWQNYEYEIETAAIRAYSFEIQDFKFCSGPIIGKNHQLFMFPFRSNDLLEYDCYTNVIQKRKLGKEKINAARCYEGDGTKIYVADYNSSIVHQYDLADQSCTAIKMGEEKDKYWGVKKVGKYLVALHLHKREIALWNQETGKTTKLTEFHKAVRRES